VAEPDRSPDALKRYLALHPYAELYAGFGDFAAWRLHIKDVQFVGGFARAWSATADAFLPAPAAVNDVAATEAAALAHCNHDHASSMAAIGQAHGGFQGSWTLAAVDVDGCNLMCGERGIYVPWLRPVTDGGSLHLAIVELSQAAREICQN
jgi:putative heme iron utilization protein